MATGKHSFVLYADLIEVIEELSDVDAGQFMKHILRYVNDLNPETENPSVKLAFIPVKQQLKRDLKKWENYIEKQSENGKKGGRPKKPKKAKKPNAFSENPTKPKKADTVTVTVTDTVNANANVRDEETRTREKHPSIEERIEVFKKEVFDYCQDKMIETRIANEFINYWTEPNQSKTKFRAEMEKTFAVPNRIGTWKKIDNERSSGKGVKKSRGSLLLDKMRTDELNNQNLLS